MMAEPYSNPIEIYFSVGLIYCVLIFFATQTMSALERRLRTPVLELEIERHKFKMRDSN